MDGDRPTDELLRRMLAAVVDTFGGPEDLDRILNTARAEAEAEVKDLLKAAIKATLLQRAVAQLESPLAAAPAPARTSVEPPEVVTEPDDESAACYVYGITWADRANGHDEVAGDVEGVDARAPLRFVRHGNLRALTSLISLAEFGGDAMAERVKDLGWVEEKVRAHDRVVKHMLAGGAVVPCRFCTVLRSEGVVRQVLARHAEHLSATLEALDGKKEWGVKVTAARATSVAPAPLDPRPADADPASGRSYFLQKRRSETARGEAARAMREAADACHLELSAVAAGVALLPIGDRGIGQRAKGAGDAPEVVLNSAYLVADADERRFFDLVDALAERYGAPGVSLEVTGPWPPYNFVRLDLSLDDNGAGAAEGDLERDAGRDAEPEAAA